MKTIAIFPAANNNDNPYQNLVASAIKKAGYKVKRIPNRKFFPFFQLLSSDIDVVQMYWPHDFYKSNMFITGVLKRLMFSLSLFILKKKKLVYSVENLVSHDANANLEFEKKWINKIVSSSNKIICSNHAAKKIFSEFYRVKNLNDIHVVPHPSYTSYYENNLTREQSKSYLKINDDGPVLIALGFVKHYKGYDQILEIISSFKSLSGTFIIAGKCHNSKLKNKLKSLIQNNKSNIKIIFRDEFIKKEEIQIYHKAADGAIFNYLDTPINPGSLILAMGFGLNILAPIVGAIPELVPEKALYGFEKGDLDQLRIQLKNFFESKSLIESGLECKEFIEDKHSIEIIADSYKNIYLEILGG
jgi:beta-1,4-mannosyltransferase